MNGMSWYEFGPQCSTKICVRSEVCTGSVITSEVSLRFVVAVHNSHIVLLPDIQNTFVYRLACLKEEINQTGKSW